LSEADLLTGIFPTDQVESLNTEHNGTRSSILGTNHCPEDHMYSRSPDEINCATVPLDVSVPSPSTGSAISSYSCSDGGSPTGTTVTDDCYSSSPVSCGMDGQHSPLAGNMEDMTLGIGVNGIYGSAVYVLQGTQLVEAIDQDGLNSLPDDNGLVSLGRFL
jgi:hypothetical protein